MDSNQRRQMYAAIGLAQGMQNLQKISQANQDLEAKRQRFELDRKVVESRLNREALDMDPDMVEQRRKLLKAQIKAQESQFTLNEIKIAEAQRQEKQKVDTYGTMMNIIQNAMESGDMSGVSMDSSGKISYKGGSGQDKAKMITAASTAAKNRAVAAMSPEGLSVFDATMKQYGFSGHNPQAEEDKFLAQEELSKQNNLNAQGSGSGPQDTELVRMIDDETGQIFDIPKSNVRAALRRGAKIMNR